MNIASRRLVLLTVFAAPVIAWATPAFAHTVNKRFGDFYGGMLHPVTAMEHLFPIIGLGLLAGQQGSKRARQILLIFLAGVLTGSVMTTYSDFLGSYVAQVNRISLIVVGLLVASAVRLPQTALVAISLFFGITHGYENTADVPQTVAVHLFLPGLLTSSLTMVVISAAAAIALDRPWQKISVRVLGSWIAAIGLLTIGLT